MMMTTIAIYGELRQYVIPKIAFWCSGVLVLNVPVNLGSEDAVAAGSLHHDEQNKGDKHRVHEDPDCTQQETEAGKRSGFKIRETVRR